MEATPLRSALSWEGIWTKLVYAMTSALLTPNSVDTVKASICSTVRLQFSKRSLIRNGSELLVVSTRHLLSPVYVGMMMDCQNWRRHWSCRSA